MTETLQHLVLEALELALGCFSDGDRAPFVMFDDESGQRNLVDFKSTDGVIDARLVESARQFVDSSTSVSRYAIVWDGLVTEDDRKIDAAIAEVGERGEPEAYLVAQKYKSIKKTRESKKLGKPMLVGTAPQRLAPAVRTANKVRARKKT